MAPPDPAGQPSLRMILRLLEECNKGSDTEKFVALSVLQNLLDSDQKLQDDPVAMTSIWHIMPHSFLIRLLRSRPSSKVNPTHSQDMNSLAIGVLHTFTNLLTQEDLNTVQTKKYVIPLIELIPITPNPHRVIAFHALQCMVGTKRGAETFLQSSGTAACLDKAILEDKSDIESVVKTLRACRSVVELSDTQQSQWEDLVTFLTPRVEDNPALMLDMLTETLNQYSIESDVLPQWIYGMLDAMKTAVLKRPSLATRTSTVLFAGALLQNVPSKHDIPKLLFRRKAGSGSDQPFSSIFVKLLLVDIRASIPSLMTILMEPSYPATALRLAMSFELITAFLSLLMQSLDEDAKASSTDELKLDPEAILQLRGDLSETLSLTLEYFRDRWDASFAGAAGLHASARTSNIASDPLLLSWDNSLLSPAKDPITLSGLRCLALWICEDDNMLVQELTVGVMDMLIALYATSTEPGVIDFRHVILTALSGLLPESTDAVDAFLEQDGWNVLAKDLVKSLPPGIIEPHVEELLRVLNLVVISNSITQTKDAWMQIITATSQVEIPTKSFGSSAMLLDDLIAAYQLALALYLKAPSRLKKLYRADLERIEQQARSIRAIATTSFTEELDFIVSKLASSLKL